MERPGFFRRIGCQLLGGWLAVVVVACFTSADSWTSPAGALLAAFAVGAILGGQHR